MTIPVYRHNLNYDDWEIASVYDSDDCGSLGGSAYDESLHSSGSLDDPALGLEGYVYDVSRPRFVNGYPVPQQQRQNHPPTMLTRPRRDACHLPGRPSAFVIPPPGVIFPRKDWDLPPHDAYWPSTASQMACSADMPMCGGLMESPPPPPLLLSPSSPPCAPSSLIKRPSPVTTSVPGTGTGANVNAYASPLMPPPPRYHEVAHAVPPRLADAGCQAHSSTAMSPPRRSGHDILSSYAPGPGHVSMARGPRSSEECTVAEGGHLAYGPGDRPDAHPPPVPDKYEHEHEHEHDGGRTRTVRPQMRERRPSMWQRFVRRLAPTHVSVGQS